MKTAFFHIVFCLFLIFPLQELSAQKKDNSREKKPVLTNKYRLKKRVQPFEGTKSRGSEKIPKEKTVVSGYRAGEKRYTEAPKVEGQSQFRGSYPLSRREKRSGFASFKSNYKFEPHRTKKGFSRFISKTKHRFHQFRRGYDKFVSNDPYLPYTKRTGYDKFISNFKFRPHEFRRGYDKFISNFKFRPHEFRRGYDKFTGGKIKYGFLEKRRKAIVSNTRRQQSYVGNIKYVNWKKVRQKRSHRLATSLGALKIKYTPRKSKLSNRQMQKYRAKPYDARRLRPGKFMWKKNMPRYQRHKLPKPKYHPKEHQEATFATSRKGDILYPYRGTWYVQKPIDETNPNSPKVWVPKQRIISKEAGAMDLPLNKSISSKEERLELLKRREEEKRDTQQEPKQN